MQSKALTILLLIMPCASQACPAGIFVEEFSPGFSGSRSGMRLFVKKKSVWKTVPLQIDPVDEDGKLEFFQSENWRREALAKTDLMLFDPKQLGDPIDLKKDKLPCKGPITYQVRDKFKKKYGYITNCGANVHPPIFPHPIKFNTQNNEIRSKSYQYVFNSENYMQFKSIAFHKNDSKLEEVALDSKMLIHADFKNFFTMNFDSDDITSVLEDKRLGPVGNMARVSFWLKVLFFEIDLKLNTNVGFFAESGHIPMMVSLPVNATDYLNSGSGILYSWQESKSTKASAKTITMPPLSTKFIETGYSNLGALGTPFCSKEYCTFEYSAVINGQKLSLTFGLNKELVKKGFFPQYVHNVNEFKSEMGWDVEANEGDRPAVYFETSGLPKGGHPWDFWLNLGGENDQNKSCPHPIKFHRIPSSKLLGKTSY